MKKSDLPEKICVVCNRPFAWRKKWEAVWDEVKYCSKRCRGKSKTTKLNSQSGDEPSSHSYTTSNTGPVNNAKRR